MEYNTVLQYTLKIKFYNAIAASASVKSPKDVQNKEVVVGVVTDMDLLHYVTQNETAKLASISENSGSTNSGNNTPENLD